MQIPAKTYLFGEYLALFQGPASIALTQPCFSLDPHARLHPECPAAGLWQAQRGGSCDWGLMDPYRGKGGLGASGAEFLLAYQQLYPGSIDLQHLHQTYFAYAQSGSGYDILAQSAEGLVVIEGSTLNLVPSAWNFPGLGFILVHTGIKLKTHEHLKDLQSIAWQNLIMPVERGCTAILDGDEDSFLAGIHDFYQRLLAMNLVAAHSQYLINDWRRRWPILAAKGCGAMGSDVIALFLHAEKHAKVEQELVDSGFEVLATHQQLFFKNAKK